ncbi:uncharacterized protein MalAC0309_2600 [Microcella alkaliphila]|uniref:Uncharacterized protein n=1 Tax=Microcella alkaliphila TaxID=279828 RepID=A0A0U5BRA1_9MICO|nr:uncharacterized protein MalAC0309_2600 [Microcella alkaliphila]
MTGASARVSVRGRAPPTQSRAVAGRTAAGLPLREGSVFRRVDAAEFRETAFAARFFGVLFATGRF